MRQTQLEDPSVFKQYDGDSFRVTIYENKYPHDGYSVVVTDRGNGYMATDEFYKPTIRKALARYHFELERRQHGGEEFLVAGEGVNPDTGHAIVNKIRDNTEVTVSVGIGETISEADKRMYRAKQNGKDQVKY